MKRLIAPLLLLVLFASTAFASDVLIARVTNYGWGQTSGVSTTTLATVDIDSINSEFADGTVIEVVATYTAIQGGNTRAFKKRTLLLVSGGETSVVASELLGSSIGNGALLLATGAVVAPGSTRTFEVQATGVLMLTVNWGVVVDTTLYRPAD